MKWYDIRENQHKWRVFNFFLGGRGIGKTYSALDYCFREVDGKMLYLRTTDVQIKVSLSPDRGNPFKKWGNDHGRDIYIRKGKEINDIIDGDEITGYAAALSTFENLRGVDFTEVSVILYDEFIQFKSLNFDSFRAFLNMYESVNRNREMEGLDPVKVFFLANTQSLNNQILAGFNLISLIEQMLRIGQQKMSINDIYVELCNSEISDIKSTNVLYRNLQDGDAYFDEAINNKFAHDNFAFVKHVKNLREFKPICVIDTITLYKHKSNGTYYVKQGRVNKVPIFNSTSQWGLWYRNYGQALSTAYARNMLKCDCYVSFGKLVDLLHLL